ncbi:response regulator transcription factor [Microbacterium gorillae]|uniref:response regulator transcription factor n=1 Tax=Microbacterium gorillae TaxID=1231063 RepID=UPI00058DF4C3|nr:response regulator transcription factor [Microbacterium gorillae]
MSDARIRVLIADDQDLVRDGLATIVSLLPDVVVVGLASDGDEAVALAVAERPDVVLMDLRMPNVDGIEATRRIAADVPEAAVLVLTTYADDDSILGALRAGARGYLTKDAGREQIAMAIRSVAGGQTTFAAEVAARVVSAAAGAAAAPVDELAARFPDLTPREREVLSLISDGLNNAEIAARLYVGVSTVKTHINALFAKLGVRDRAQAIARVRS